MLTPNAKGYLLTVALFVVCCWVNPNDAIPYRIRPQAKEQVDQRVRNRVERSAVNVAHRGIGQPYLEADKKPALSGGGKNWRPLQHSRSTRSRTKNLNVNVNVNMNRNRMGRVGPSSGRLPKINHWASQLPKVDQSTSSLSKIDDTAAVTAGYDIPKTSMEPLTTETINCSEPHNANDRYSSSFNRNSSLKVLNVRDDFQVAGEAGTKKTSSVHVGEDITLCWIETTTIKEDQSVRPVQRFVVREYTISFENSATIPERYLECVQLEGELNGKNNSIPRSALFEVMDENTRHSRVVNFTTVSHSDDLIVWQHKRVRCGVGPVVTKNIVEWADERSDHPKQRVEIKVSPKIHRLTAQPTDTVPCTTDLGPQLTSTITPNPPLPVDCGPGMTCHSYSDCVGEHCGHNIPNGDTMTLVLREETTQSYMTTIAAYDEMDKSTNTNDYDDLTELLSTAGATVPLLVRDEMNDSSEEMSTPASVSTETGEDDDGLFTVAPMEVTTIVDYKRPTISLFEISNSTESSSVLSVTLNHETDAVMETGNQEVEMPAISEELNSRTREIDESCENWDSCLDSISEGSSVSLGDFSNSEMETTDTATYRDSESSYTEEFTETPTTDVSSTQKIEPMTYDDETDFFREKWETTTEIKESDSSSTITETMEAGSNIMVTELMDSPMMMTESSIGITDPSESITSIAQTTENTVESRTLTQCDLSSDYCAESTEATMIEGRTELTERSLALTTTPETIEVWTLLPTLGYETTMEGATININDLSFEVTMPQTTSHGETTTEQITSGISDATNEVTISSANEFETTVFSYEETTNTVTELYREGSTTNITDVTTKTNTYITDGSVQETTGPVLSTTVGQSDLQTITETVPDSILSEFPKNIHQHTTHGVTETSDTTADANEDIFTHNIRGGISETTTETVTVSGNEVTTTDYSTVFGTQTGTTEKSGNLKSNCDAGTGECEITKPANVTQITLQPCDPESASCDINDDSTTSSCDEESGNCSFDSLSLLIAKAPEMLDATDLPLTTSSTPIEVENTSTTVSDVPTTVEIRKSTTVEPISRDPMLRHKLALRIKILLDHIDENKKKQELVEVEKHLLFNEPLSGHGSRSLMNQVRTLNNSVSMRTIQALFNCSTVENLTGDVGDFTAKYLTTHDGIQKVEEPNSNFSGTKDLHVRKPRDLSAPAKAEVDPNIEMSLPGIHVDIHSGLSHVMTWLPLEHKVERRSIFEIVADPLDERLQTRRKRETIEDLTIDEKDLPKDVEEVGHWSNERMRRAIDGGHVRTLTEFTIYKGP